ncbi:hypothetical protein JTB14_016377 [Gonioctena quinquepunctata]|nr:hypothetical protein JTB14_016377 [Gonioctena quinquepunctata]
MEEVRLKALIDRNVAAMGDKLGCTHTAEHVIVTNAVPIEQRYYPVSPVIQQQVDKELDAMLSDGHGLFQFRRMPIGFHYSPDTWQRLIDRVLGPELEPHVFVYLDDVVVVAQTSEKHLSVFYDVFRRLREANMAVNLEKCHFCRPEMKYLGHVVDRNGLHVDPDKVKSIPTSTSVKDVHRLIGQNLYLQSPGNEEGYNIKLLGTKPVTKIQQSHSRGLLSQLRNTNVNSPVNRSEPRILQKYNYLDFRIIIQVPEGLRRTKRIFDSELKYIYFLKVNSDDWLYELLNTVNL